MPPKKKATRPAQINPPAAQSDYDTDANFTDQASTIQHPPQRTPADINLAVLRRYCPEVVRIICIAPFAVVYTYLPEAGAWDKAGIEGTLFVSELSGAPFPRFNVIIINRKSLENFVMELDSPDTIEDTESYLIFNHLEDDGTEAAKGLWIFTDLTTGTNMKEFITATVIEHAMRAENGRILWERGEVQPTNGEHSFGLDGATYSQPEEDGAFAPPPPSAGQSVDMSQLFGQKQAERASPTYDDYPLPQQNFAQQQRFVSTSDTDFFRTTSSPAVNTPQQAQQSHQALPATQANALLNLFKK